MIILRTLFRRLRWDQADNWVLLASPTRPGSAIPSAVIVPRVASRAARSCRRGLEIPGTILLATPRRSERTGCHAFRLSPHYHRHNCRCILQTMNLPKRSLRTVKSCRWALKARPSALAVLRPRFLSSIDSQIQVLPRSSRDSWSSAQRRRISFTLPHIPRTAR
jgi:hypothetical protein